MGQKATDLMVARVCQGCHQQVQGKRALAFRRNKDWETWIALQSDAMELLTGYVEHLENPRCHNVSDLYEQDNASF